MAFTAICVGVTPSGRRWLAITVQPLRRPFVILAGVLVILFLALYPIAKSGWLGPGSDRDDALNVALAALLAGSYPYHALTYLGNPPTPMPGALLLALPFYVIGNSALQNLFWMPIFVRFCRTWFINREVALFFSIMFVLACPGVLQDYVTGGDYAINCIYVAIAIDLVARRCDRDWSRWQIFLAYGFLAVALSSRPIFIVSLPVIAAWLLQRTGLRAAVEFAVYEVLALLLINGPFYFHDPASFPAFNLSGKLADLPQSFYPGLLVPALCIAIASLSFFTWLNRCQIFGMISAGFVPMFYPLYTYQLIMHGPDPSVLPGAGYSVPLAIFGGLWATGFLIDPKRGPATATTSGQPKLRSVS